MEISAKCETAQDLFVLLSSIPQHLREQLPIIVIADEDQEVDTVSVNAYSVHETEGCLEQGLQIISSLK